MKRFSLVFCIFLLFSAFVNADEVRLPENWLTEWNIPTAKNRPLQIIHGYYGDRITPEKLRYYKDDCGLGGLVINVPSQRNNKTNGYLRNEDEWQRFKQLVASAKEIGLRIWIYDEDGYPSLGAGGLVLEGHPELESTALVYDKNTDKFAVRPAYEYTHAASNYSALRRYPNPLNPAATKRGIELTHEAYKKHLGDLHSYIEAYFTDEPSLNAVNIGTIPADVQKQVFTADPLDENVPLLPMLVWCDELEKMNFSKKSLFTGDTDADKSERQRFWAAVSQLNTKYYYQAIQNWCKENEVASSGHTLHEENLLGHVPLDGNKLSVLRAMDIPGLDLLNSNPNGFEHGQWKTCGFPASAAALNNSRRVFTEISDFSQKMSGDKKPAPLNWMTAAAACQAAFGVTEFTLYYRIDDRPIEQHREYCRYAGRLNALLHEAKPVYNVVLFYPITAMQREYKPTAEPLNIKNQSETAQAVSRSFDFIGALLARNQIPFIIADEQGIKDYQKLLGKKNIPVIVPLGSELPQNIIQSGVIEINDTADAHFAVDNVRRVLGSQLETVLPSNGITFGKFERDGYTMYLLVNITDKPYQGKLQLPAGETKPCVLLFPDSGTQQQILVENDVIPISIQPYQSVFAVVR